MAVNEVCNLPVSHSLSSLFRFSSCVCLGARLQGLLRGANFSSSLSKKPFLLMETNSRLGDCGFCSALRRTKEPRVSLGSLTPAVTSGGFSVSKQAVLQQIQELKSLWFVLCSSVPLVTYVWFLTWFSLWKQIFKLLGKRKDGQWPFVRCWESQHWSLIPRTFYVEASCKKKLE